MEERKSSANLVQNRLDITPEQRRAAARKAGQASGRARRARRSMQETADLILGGALPLWTNKQLEDMGIRIRNTRTVQEAIIMEQVATALGFNGAKAGEMTRAAEFLRDTVGDKNPEKIDMQQTDGLAVTLNVVE